MNNELRTRTIVQIMTLKSMIYDLEVAKAKCIDPDRDRALNASLHEKRKALREHQEVFKSIEEDWCFKTETYIHQLEAKLDQLQSTGFTQAANELQTDIVGFKKKLSDRKDALNHYINE